MAYMSLGAFNYYISINVSAGRLDEDDEEDEGGYDLLSDVGVADVDRDRPVMGFGTALLGT